MQEYVNSGRLKILTWRGILLLIVLAVKNQHFGVLPDLRRWEIPCEITKV